MKRVRRMLERHALRSLTVGLALVAMLRPAGAITVVMDYRYDLGFFSMSTTNGQAARATVNAAASYFSTLISDTLSSIPFTNPLTGSDKAPVWRQVITHPGTGQANYSISSAANAAEDGLAASLGPASEYDDIRVPANELRVYAGGSDMSQLAIGGTGVSAFGTQAFRDTILQRGKPSNEYATWGGYVSFDTTGVAWHYRHDLPVTSGMVDLYSVALHEIGHVLGLSTSTPQWNQFQPAGQFEGSAALAAWKADDPSAPANATGIPTVSTTDHHWKDNVGGAPSVRSKVIGTHQLQEAAMDASIIVGTRKHFTNVDGKALVDIGWTIPPSAFNAPAATLAADFNSDGLVDGADLSAWGRAFRETAGADADDDGDSDGADFLAWQRQRGLAGAGGSGEVAGAAVPEANSAVLAGLGGAALAGARRRRLACLSVLIHLIDRRAAGVRSAVAGSLRSPLAFRSNS